MIVPAIQVANCRHIPDLRSSRFNIGNAHTICLRCNHKMIKPLGGDWQIDSEE